MHTDTASLISTPHFQLGSGLWNNVPNHHLQIVLADESRKARKILNDRGITTLTDSRLQLIAMAAAEATLLLFNAAMEEPTREDLDRFFEEFVLAAAPGAHHDVAI